MTRANSQPRTPSDDELSRAQINFDRVHNGVRAARRVERRERGKRGAIRLIVSIKIMRKEQLFCLPWIISSTRTSNECKSRGGSNETIGEEDLAILTLVCIHPYISSIR